MGGNLWRKAALLAVASLVMFGASAAQPVGPATPASGVTTPGRVPASQEHVVAATHALQNAYAVTDSTNGVTAPNGTKTCPSVATDMYNWPAARVVHCVYRERDDGVPGGQRTAVAYLLTIDAPTLARWIETACANVPVDAKRCFDTVLRDGAGNSGYMFAIAGNVIENMSDPHRFKNYFFRNGMTVSFNNFASGGDNVVTADDQEAIAQLPDSQIRSIPTGFTRPWRTTPGDFAWRFPSEGPPADLDTLASKRHWLARVQSEMLAALQSDHNRLLEAWLCAHAQAELGAACTSRHLTID